jgi:hypothetical protein
MAAGDPWLRTNPSRSSSVADVLGQVDQHIRVRGHILREAAPHDARQYPVALREALDVAADFRDDAGDLVAHRAGPFAGLQALEVFHVGRADRAGPDANQALRRGDVGHGHVLYLVLLQSNLNRGLHLPATVPFR